MKLVVLLSVISFTGFIFLACGNQSTFSGNPSLQETTNQVTQTSKKEVWEIEWQKTLESAKKEKKLVIYTTWGPESRVAIQKHFLEKMGINPEFVAGRPAEIVEKIVAERRSGLFITDVLLSGTASPLQGLKPKGALESPEKYLILPEVLDNKAWWGGELLSPDKERTFVQFFAYPDYSNIFNKEQVQPGEIVSYKDLLNPKWKGKIIIGDPVGGGSAMSILFFIGQFSMGWDYLRALAKQEPVILRDERQMIEWVARGKNPIAVGTSQVAIIAEFQKLGLPIDVLSWKEGGPLTGGAGNVTVLEKAPHPNAARIFLNWLLTREGQTLVSRSEVKQRAREDVPVDHLSTWLIRQQGATYINFATEEMKKAMYDSKFISADIMGIR